MRVGLDLHTVTGVMQGSRTYIDALTRAMLRLKADREYLLYLPDHAPTPAYAAPNALPRSIPRSRIKRLLTFGRGLRRDRADLLHCQYLAPPRLPCPAVVTLHDILHETNPEFYPGTLRRLMALLYPPSARRAAAVITGSEYSRREITARYRVPGERVHVTPYAADEAFSPQAPEACLAVTRRYGITGRYILFVGRIEPRKNIPGLVEAFSMLAADGATGHTLVVAGMMDDLFRDFHARTTARFGSRVLFTGKVAPEDLPGLYAGADLFAYPSFAEGFGLPPLEAMACGTPVVASNTTSIPEVVGDAGLLVAPDDTAELARAMGRVLTDADLHAQLRGKGLEQARLFSWERTARQTLAIYDAVTAP
jgi:glycosyltransferase involved in cell wall biosynthesis